jgi:hypothetical protein
MQLVTVGASSFLSVLTKYGRIREKAVAHKEGHEVTEEVFMVFYKKIAPIKKSEVVNLLWA